VTKALEAGAVVFLPDLRFAVDAAETALFRTSILGRSKSASFDPATWQVGGVTLDERDAAALASMIRRFSDAALALVLDLLPLYRSQVERRRASFRPAEISGRVTTWRKDDTRLHVDSSTT
jgi:hypothetical protein